MKIAFYTLGCRLNFAESSDLARRALEAGYEVVEFDAGASGADGGGSAGANGGGSAADGGGSSGANGGGSGANGGGSAADWYVINTCAVTAAAEKKCRQIIRQAHRRNPSAGIVVAGCFSELRPEDVKALEGVDIVLGTHNKHLLFEYLARHAASLPESAPAASLSEAAPAPLQAAPRQLFVPSYSTIGRTRSFFKVQDGCDNFCSYCAIPYARGRSRSDTVARTVETAREIATRGIKELVLTGVNIGDFGRDGRMRRGPNENFYNLLKELDRLDTIARIRIGSVEPDLLSDEIIDLIAASDRLMPHFHIPLQAGHNDVLRKMRRRYTREDYAERVRTVRRKIPHAFIACDLIVGFPTETDAQFEDAYHFIEDMDLSALHVFPYSDRAEAPASKIRPVYGPHEKQRRSAAMLALSDRAKESFYRRFVGSAQTVLWESDARNGRMYGYTPNYLRVFRPEDPSLANSLQEVRLGSPYRDADKDWILPCS